MSDLSTTTSVTSAAVAKRPGTMPRTFASVLVVAAVFGVFLIWDQSIWWRTRDEYMFGFLVPLFVAYIVYDRWAAMTRELAAVTTAPTLIRAGAAGRVMTILAGLGLVGGLGVFALGALYRANSGASQPGSLALAAGSAAVVLGMIYLAIPAGMPNSADSAADGRASGGWRMIFREARWRITGLFLFPAAVWMLSAPLVTAVENAVSLYLLGKVTVVVFTVFDLLGFPIERQGSTLLLPLGQVGVAEACSGIRSLTGSIFSGCFLAAAFLRAGWKKVLLVGCAVVLAFVMNLVRSLVLTAVAYAYGPTAIEGTVHDVTGFAVLGLTFVGLLCLLPLFGEGSQSEQKTED